MRRRFFVESFRDATAMLSGEAAEHLGRVLRAEPGQLYELSDGQHAWLGRVERVALEKRGASRIEFALVEPIAARERQLRVELLISLVKFDRFEWCLEKATELGVAEIAPLCAERSEKALIAAAAKRFSRWEKILFESAQQSRQLGPPKLLPAALPEKIFQESRAARKLFLSERREAPAIREVLSKSGGAATVSLAFGPEGGWTEKEIAAARDSGFAEVSLGENILRTETAVIAALAIVSFAWGGDGAP